LALLGFRGRWLAVETACESQMGSHDIEWREDLAQGLVPHRPVGDMRLRLVGSRLVPIVEVIKWLICWETCQSSQTST
jgi:hypothetical protein